jgi:glycosyltransferase involved in cell wall biosynthesis
LTDPSTREPTEGDRVAQLKARIAELEAELREVSERSAVAHRPLEREVDRAVRLAGERQPAVAVARADLERIKSRRIVRIGVVVLHLARSPLKWARRRAKSAMQLARGLARRVGLRRLFDPWGPALYRSVLLDRLHARGRWSSQPLHIGITVTRDDESAGYGDWYTAHELGDAVARLGWKVSYLERHRDRWYGLAPSCDVVVSLLPEVDLFRVPRHVITVAWIRNWTEEWTAKAWFDNYDVVLVSSGRSKEIVEQQSAQVAHVFPLATNPQRFYPRPPNPALSSDAVFVGSHWGVERGIDEALPVLAASGHRVAIYGRGWEDQPGLADLSGGLLPYDSLPEVYSSAALAIDDAAISTKPYGSVNSRVFDALAVGTLVLTDNALGVRELFDEDFPTWDDAESLVAGVGDLLADLERRSALAERYRRQVLARHTYDHRAAELKSLLVDWALAAKIAVHIGPQTSEKGRTWGDVPLGRDVQRQLKRKRSQERLKPG